MVARFVGTGIATSFPLQVSIVMTPDLGRRCGPRKISDPCDSQAGIPVILYGLSFQTRLFSRKGCPRRASLLSFTTAQLEGLTTMLTNVSLPSFVGNIIRSRLNDLRRSVGIDPELPVPDHRISVLHSLSHSCICNFNPPSRPSVNKACTSGCE